MNNILEITVWSELALRGCLDDQTRLILINNAARGYEKLRGADALHNKLRVATQFATARQWDKFYQVVNSSIKELKQLSDVEDCPGQAVRG